MKKKLVIMTLVIMSILSQISFGGDDDLQKPILQRVKPLIHHLDYRSTIVKVNQID